MKGCPRSSFRLHLEGRRQVIAAARRRNPALFEVNDISPPPESLGVHSLPPVRVCHSVERGSFHLFLSHFVSQNTTNGDEIEVNGQSYIVKTTTIRYKLERGRYVRDKKRVDVLGTSRYLSNLYLNQLLEKSS